MPNVKRGLFEPVPVVRCPNCGYEGKGKYVVPGSLFVELVLRMCFIVPGLLYTNYRSRNTGYVCKDCMNEYVVRIRNKD